MGFYFRVAPGLRLRVTGRGLRASVGPRAARLHFGAGGPGISTGAGPVSYYHALPGGSPARDAAGGARATKLVQAQQVNAIWERLFSVHQQTFPPAGPQQIPPPTIPTRGEFVKAQGRMAVAELPCWRIWTRRRLRVLARQQADLAWPTQVAALQAAHHQAELAEQDRWRRLLANDPAVTLAQLQDAFEDNDLPSAPVAIHGSEASIALLAPDPEVMPERIGGVTDAGNVSLRKLTKGERQSLITAITCGYALVTAREALAVAPSLDSVRIVVLRHHLPQDPAKPALDCVLAARWTRAALLNAPWTQTDAYELAHATATEFLVHLRSNALHPVNLDDQPDLHQLIDTVEPQAAFRPEAPHEAN